MIKIIDRYIIKEVLAPFILSLFVFTFVLFMNQILRLSDLLINKGIDFFIIFELIIFILPSFLVITIPVSTLTAAILAFSRLSSDGEIIALKAGGVSLYRMIMPVLTFSLFTGIITIYLTIYAMPYGNFAFKNLIYNTIKTKAFLGIEDGIFNDTFENLMIFVKEMPKPEKFKGIFISDLRNPKEANLIIAKSGAIIADKEAKNIILRLKDGSLHRGAELSDAYQKVDFTSYDLQLNIEVNRSKLAKDRLEMTIGELMIEIDKRKKENKNYTAHLMEIHKKFSMPFACLLMGVIGAPLGITSKRSGKSTGFAIAIGIALVYYLISTLGDFLGRLDFINAFLAIWLPNIFFTFIGIFLIVKIANESPFKTLRLFFDLYYYVLNKLWIKKK